MRPLLLLANGVRRLTGFALAFLATVAACDSDDAKTCSVYEVPAGTDLTAPAVSFKRDVMPVFAGSCSFTSCHGGRAGDLHFEIRDAVSTRAAIVSVPAPELPTMPYVTPGDPSRSFLMRKMDGDLCPLEPTCKDGDCGASMPQSNEVLDVPTRDVIRRWIAQGAPDN